MNYHYKVDNYLESLPEKEKEVAELLRQLIFNLVPDAEERFSFGIPFYHYFGMFCYLNYQKKGGIEFCLCRGKDLVMGFPEIELKNRKQIAGITFYDKKGIDIQMITSLLAEAAHYQKEAKLAGKPYFSGKIKKA